MKLSDVMDDGDKGAKAMPQEEAPPPTEMEAPGMEAAAPEEGMEAATPEEAVEEAMPEEEAAETSDSPEPTPEEQEWYDKVVLAGNELLFGKGHAATMQRLKSMAENPAQAICDLVFDAIVEFDSKTKRAIPESVILPAAMELGTAVCELAQASGVVEVDETVWGQAQQMLFVKLCDQYGVDEETAKAELAKFSPEEIDKAHAEQDAIGQAGAEAPPEEPPPPGVIEQAAA